ncbi:GNAT family N-acetyltransferase [Neobacillus cucumis]|uniref:GNAT family N-acetyltransferase n=1 Tax=Neobacillus cucumis TaxID=1740721 RepID=A0A2N5HB72_9BACI|nr:GNAT family N-acetyltransferase [Neobacillus cucumis]PLS02758.1 GNAT family N-acetyltransferase [Neobacillus cucumis]
MSISFEELTKETLYIALEIINSNPQYNVMENGNKTRSLAELNKELLNPHTISAFIKLDDTYIGVIDYMLENPKDSLPWLGLLIIHSDYQGFGFGSQAYELYESEIKNRGLDKVRIGVLQENTKAQHFWESLGFVYYITSNAENESGILCYEKQISCCQ